MTKRLLLCAFITFWLCIYSPCQEPASPPANADLEAASGLYDKGKFSAAEEKYSAILKSSPGMQAAQVGLIRSLLRQEKVDLAFTSAESVLSAQPNSAALLAAMGDVQFRRAEMGEAETDYVKALKLDRKEVAAYVGLARLDYAYSLYGRAYRLVSAAHQLAPNDPDVAILWMRTLPRSERIAAMEKYLDQVHDPEEKKDLQEELQYLKAAAGLHACKAVRKVEQSEIKLNSLVLGPQDRYTVNVRVNDHNARLVLDTGASGIILFGRTAGKSNVKKIVDMRYGGAGEKGVQLGYAAVADHIRLGEFEFDDCVVQVAEKASFPDEDGLIGTDVFRDYLVELDMPAQKLKLSGLPPRPGEAVAATTSLGSEGATHTVADSSAEEEHAQADGKSKPSHMPKDRYVAPEMANWIPVFRFGHALLIPTRVNNSKPLLFLIDTGDFDNNLSTAAAKRESAMHRDDFTVVEGLSGSVGRVYRTRARLEFGGLHQENQSLVTYDMSGISADFGTETSGILGFGMLQLLDLKIDYRDGLVNFTYTPKKK